MCSEMYSISHINSSQDTIRDLASRKQNLLLELRNYEENQKGSTLNPGSVEVDGTQLGIIPANTQLQTAINVNLGVYENDSPKVSIIHFRLSLFLVAFMRLNSPLYILPLPQIPPLPTCMRLA